MSDKYILDEHGEPQRCDDLKEWALWWERADAQRLRVVKQDYDESSENAVGVSTVFLGLDHNFTAKGPPVLWESLVFGTSLDGEMRRYTSKADAIRGHEELLRRVSEVWQKENGR